MPATLTRGTLGRLYAGGATALVIANVRPAFSASDWTIQASAGAASVFLDGSGNLGVGVTSFGQRAWASCTPIASRSDVYIQANWVQLLRTGDSPGLLARYQNNTGADLVSFERSGPTIYEKAGNVVVRSNAQGPGFIRPVRIQMRVAGSEAAGKVTGGGQDLTLSSVGGSAGSTGINVFNNNGIQNGCNCYFDQYYATRNHLLTVTSSLADGWYIAILDASNVVLAESGNAVAGSATIDMYQRDIVLPLAVKIEIREYATGNVLVSDVPIETVWPGDEWTFTPDTGYSPPASNSRLLRSVLGRLYAHANWASSVFNVTNRFLAADWTGFSLTGTVTPSLNATTGALQLVNNSGTGQRGVRYATALTADQFILMARVSSTTGVFSGAHSRSEFATPGDDSVRTGMPIGFTSTSQINEYVGGTAVQSSVSASSNRTASLTSSHSLWVRSSLADSRQISAGGTGPADVTLTLTGLSASTNGLFGGIHHGSSNAVTTQHSAWAAMRSAILTVNGPNSGTWQVRLRNAAGTLIYTSASHTGGVVEINTQTELTVLYSAGIPLARQIEIYDPGTATVIRGPEVSYENLWGGDVWAWNFPPPPIPANLVADNPSSSTIDVSWDVSAGADTYEVDRSLNGLTGWANVYAGTGTSFIDSGLAFATTYFYRVRAANTYGASAYSAAVSETTLAGAPDAPTAPVVTALSAFSLGLVWTPVANTDEYEVERSLTGVGAWTPIYTGSFNSTEDVGLAPLTTYFYRVRGCNVFGCGPWSVNGSGTTLAPPVPPGLKRAYRLRIRDASTEANPDGTTDVFSVTSLRD